MKKFKYFKPILAVCVLAVCLVGVTFALQVTGVLSITNAFTAASNSTEINEDGPEKKVSITNNGSNPTYVRARVTVEGTDGALPEDVTFDYTWDVNETPDPNEILVVMGDSTKWILNSTDAFYYYQGIVEPGDSTELLVQKVLVGANVPATLEFDVVVTEESVLAVEEDFTEEGMQAAFDQLDQ